MTARTRERTRLVVPFRLILVALSLVTLVASCTPEPDSRPQTYRLGLITNSANGLENVQGFKAGMAELGYVEGENIVYLFDEAPTSTDRLKSVLEDLVAAKVDLIFTAGTPTGVAAYQVTAGTEVPVVFGVIADPIEAGVVSDLTRPGGNMTGVMLGQDQGIRLQLLAELRPGIKRIFVPHDPTDTASTSAINQIIELAPGLDMEIVEGYATTDDEVSRLLEDIPPNVDAIFLVPGTTVNARLPDWIAVATERKLPLSGPSTTQVIEGALITYGFIHQEVGIQAARIADQILKGTRPAEIPVEIASSFLAINLRAAEAIGLEVPYELLQQAEIIIRDDGEGQ